MKLKRLLTLGLIGAMSAVSFASTQVTLEGEVFDVDTLKYEKVGPGTMYTYLYLKSQTKATHMRAHFLTMDVKGNDKLDFRMELGNDSLLTVERPSDVAKRKTQPGQYYFAGINADFYITWDPHIGNPNMACYRQGQVAMFNPIPQNNMGHFIIDKNNYMWCDYINEAWSMVKPDGTKVWLSHINHDRGADQLVLFNENQGHYTKTTGGKEIRVKLAAGESWGINKDIKLQVVGEAKDGGNMFIHPGEAVLSASGERMVDVEALHNGDIFTLHFYTGLGDYNIYPENIEEISGGDVVILKRGEIVYEASWWINGRDNFNPRSMFGYTQDRSKMIWGLIDGRTAMSSGSTYPQGAGLMRFAGCYDAVDVDGGGSSTMYVQNLGVLNNPSDGHERAVSNGLYAVLNAPEDNNIAEIRFVDWAMNFPKYGIYTPKFYGYNQYGMLIDTDVQGVKLSCDSKLGTIINDGVTFYGTGEGCKALTAELNGMKATIPVTIVSDVDAHLRLKNILIDDKHEYPVEVNATVLEKEMPMSPMAFTWASDNEQVATITADGILKGVADGDAVVTGKLGAYSGDLNVKVQIPTATTMPVNYPTFPTDWKLKQTGGKGIAISEFENGFKLDYTGNGAARGAYISVEHPMVVWSLPEAIKITVNPGDATIKKISMNAENALGERIASWAFTTETLAQNTPSTYELKLADWCNPNDLGIYPIQINSLRFDMGASKKDAKFTISVPAFEGVYPLFGGVESNTVAEQGIKVYPNPVKVGEAFNVAVEGQAMVEVFAMNGMKVLSTMIDGASAVSTQGLHAGIYFVKVVAENSVKTAKLIVK